jgi:hypothetical protein
LWGSIGVWVCLFATKHLNSGSSSPAQHTNAYKCRLSALLVCTMVDTVGT